MDASTPAFETAAPENRRSGRPPLDMGKAKKPGYQPIRALRAVGTLIKDKEDTAQVFEIMQSLAGKSIPKGYQKLISTAEGGKIAYEREEFADFLMNQDWLASFGPGTVGAAYRDFIAPRGLSAEGLAAESRAVKDSQVDAAHPLVWYGRRLRDVHDIWHVLTGYGTDALGEACIVSFSYPQTKSLGWALIARAAAGQFRKAGNGQPYAEAIREGGRLGKQAAWLPGIDYPALFGENLEAARARLRIGTPVIYKSIPAELRDKFSTPQAA